MFRHSDDFDYSSIMIYDSFFGMSEGVQRFPLMTNDENIIYLGGHPNPDKAGLSNLDVERVAALYPRQQAEHAAMQPRYSNDTQVKQPTLSVVIPDFVTTIVGPVPTDFPKSVKDLKAFEIARQYAADCAERCSGAMVNW